MSSALPQVEAPELARSHQPSIEARIDMTVAASMQAGEAGHCGADIRSDLHVQIEPRERGGIHN